MASSQRPVVILPGLGNNTADYSSLAKSLEERGFPCAVAEVARADWLRNAAGLLDANYWRGTLKPRPILDWYLHRVEKAVKKAKRLGSAPGQGVSVVAHSAGGWLARLFMAEFGYEGISLLLTLGTPHLPPPRGVSGVVDQTRGLLYHIEESCPGAYHAPAVRYVCISGRFLRGSPLIGSSGSDTESEGSRASEKEAEENRVAVAVAAAGGTLTPSEPTASVAAFLSRSPAAAGASDSGFLSDSDGAGTPSLQSRIVGQGYKQVCGEATVWGDGVVPEPSALLPGAVHVILDGVFHSPVGANDERAWYGSEEVLPKWIDYLYE